MSKEKPKQDAKAAAFLEHLRVERNASVYTIRNYQQALTEFQHWHEADRGALPIWKSLGCDDFRGYLRFVGRQQKSRAAIMLRFSALRSFYKFLMRRGEVEASPIKGVAIPKAARRLPK